MVVNSRWTDVGVFRLMKCYKSCVHHEWVFIGFCCLAGEVTKNEISQTATPRCIYLIYVVWILFVEVSGDTYKINQTIILTDPTALLYFSTYFIGGWRVFTNAVRLSSPPHPPEWSLSQSFAICLTRVMLTGLDGTISVPLTSILLGSGQHAF